MYRIAIFKSYRYQIVGYEMNYTVGTGAGFEKKWSDIGQPDLDIWYNLNSK